MFFQIPRSHNKTECFQLCNPWHLDVANAARRCSQTFTSPFKIRAVAHVAPRDLILMEASTSASHLPRLRARAHQSSKLSLLLLPRVLLSRRGHLVLPELLERTALMESQEHQVDHYLLITGCDENPGQNVLRDFYLSRSQRR